jgi:hypothetical protein
MKKLLVVCVLVVALSISCGGGGSGIHVSTVRSGSSEKIGLGGGELKEIPFSDFAFVVTFDSPDESMIQWRVYAQKGTKEGAESNFFFPENDAANEVEIRLDIMADGKSVSVTPASGQFPSASQVVLVLDWVGGVRHITRVFIR